MEAELQKLFDAATAGDTKLLDQLGVDHHPEIFKTRKWQGDLAAHVALHRGHLDFATEICSRCPPAAWLHNKTGDSLLHLALKRGQPEFFRRALRFLHDYFDGDEDRGGKRYDDGNRYCWKHAINGENKSLLYLAVERGYVEAVKILLENNLLNDPTGPNNSTALHAAVRERNYGTF